MDLPLFPPPPKPSHVETSHHIFLSLYHFVFLCIHHVERTFNKERCKSSMCNVRFERAFWTCVLNARCTFTSSLCNGRLKCRMIQQCNGRWKRDCFLTHVAYTHAHRSCDIYTDDDVEVVALVWVQCCSHINESWHTYDQVMARTHQHVAYTDILRICNIYADDDVWVSVRVSWLGHMRPWLMYMYAMTHS